MGADAARRRTARSVSGARAPRPLDPLVHEQARLAILAALAAAPAWTTFVELKHALGLTDGNLSVHGRRLEDAAYVECRKSFDGRIPRTEYRLTPKGRKALTAYLDHMEAVIRAARGPS